MADALQFPFIIMNPAVGDTSSLPLLPFTLTHLRGRRLTMSPSSWAKQTSSRNSMCASSVHVPSLKSSQRLNSKGHRQMPRAVV